MLLLLFASTLNAGVLSFSLDLPYGGTAAPSGKAPWLSATFTDLAPAGPFNVVELVLTAKSLTGTEFIEGWYFNLDPLYTSPLSVTYQEPPASTGPKGQFKRGLQDSQDANGKNGEGAGFDLFFDFFDETAAPGSADLFGPDESVTFRIAGTGIFASSFDFLNAKGNFFSAARIGGIGPGSGFAWIADARGNGPEPAPVPEPATLLIFSLGLGGTALFGRVRLKK
jgi:hypothetical protein